MIEPALMYCATSLVISLLKAMFIHSNCVCWYHCLRAMFSHITCGWDYLDKLSETTDFIEKWFQSGLKIMNISYAVSRERDLTR